MLDAHQQLRFAPSYISRPRRLECGPSRRETLHLSQELYPGVVTKSDECRSRVIQAFAIRMREQSPKRSGLAVAVSADHDKGGFGEAFGL
jgi:hypothetical protein